MKQTKRSSQILVQVMDRSQTKNIHMVHTHIYLGLKRSQKSKSVMLKERHCMRTNKRHLLYIRYVDVDDVAKKGIAGFYGDGYHEINSLA